MAIKAAKDALTNYNINPLKIDLVLSTHISKNINRLTPPNANIIQLSMVQHNLHTLFCPRTLLKETFA